MDRGFMERVKAIMDDAKGEGDLKKAAPKLEAVLDDPGIDTTSNEYFMLADLVLNAHDVLSREPGGDRKTHLLRQKEIHERILANPYSYLFPHRRIISEFEIGHIELFLNGIERKRIVGREETAVEVEVDA